MRVKALASISGPMGRKAAGEEFEVKAAEGTDLINRKLVAPVEGSSPTPTPSAEAEPEPSKTPKARKAKS
ncbi:hypothetical protein AAH995_29385 [Pseudomonas putida]|uniref:hypothetical protein n=1 Tax=Pseudomonas putida TaxID=303 RepID=UPI00349ED20E